MKAVGDILRFVLFACVRAINSGWGKGHLAHDFRLVCEAPFGMRLNCLIKLPFNYVGHFFVYFYADDSFKDTFPPISFTFRRWV